MSVINRIIASAGAFSFFAGCSLSVSHAAPPDIVIIMADDLGYSDLGAYGGEIRTPNIDGLAENGVRFTQFYAENMCRPSRIALLTGTYTKAAMRDYALHPAAQTIAEALRDEGYRTYLSGKWHVGRAGESALDRGFDHFYGILSGATNYFTPEHLLKDDISVREETDDPNFHLTDAISKNATQFIRQTNLQDRLFLFVAYTAPHWPLHAFDEDIAAYDGVYDEGWDAIRRQRFARMQNLGLLSEAAALTPRLDSVEAWDNAADTAMQQRRMQTYAAQVTQLDRGVGEIIDALKATGRFENTLIMVLSDNGGNDLEFSVERYHQSDLPLTTRGEDMQPGNASGLRPGPAHTYQSYGSGWATLSNTPLRYFKKYAHEGGIKVPLIVHWPAQISQSSLFEQPTHIIDILPTLTSAAGRQVTRHQTWMPIDGRSLLPGLVEEETDAGHEALFFHHARGKALRTKDWKLVARDQEPWELYRIASDGFEMKNLAEQHPDLVKTLSDAWHRKAEELAQRNETYAKE